MATKTIIASLAQSHIGGRPFTNIDTDVTPNAAIIRLWFDVAREEFLRTHAWNFATKRATLSADSTAPDFGFALRYQIPADCVKIISLEDVEQEYVVEQNYLLAQPTYYNSTITSPTSANTINVKYIFDNTDYAAWPGDCINMFSMLLASYIAQDVNGPNAGGGKNAELRRNYEMLVQQAKLRDAREMRQKLTTKDVYSEVVQARFGVEF